ncbi:MAG: hypothetical protein FWD57_06520 [Polyangiaceae bacterium]|nr:hypothetical protein [Polyangiaceae bacterium]
MEVDAAGPIESSGAFFMCCVATGTCDGGVSHWRAALDRDFRRVAYLVAALRDGVVDRVIDGVVGAS